MAAPEPGTVARGSSIRIGALLLAFVAAGAARSEAASDIINTRHNLSVSGPGSVRALTETRVCIFCHTPHNAAPAAPLWNRSIEPTVYTVYASPTLKAGPLAQPTGPTKLCLTCHDGSIAVAAVLNPAEGIPMANGGVIPTGGLSNFGLDLSGHHPVSFPYSAALPNPELVSPPPPELSWNGAAEVHCTTCHDPHDDSNGRFLVMDNRSSALCVTCHQLPGWSSSAHATSTASVVGVLPRPPRSWPTWTTLGEWGCEGCHTPHFAPTAEALLIFTSAPPDPFTCTSAGCHSGPPPPPHGPATGSAVGTEGTSTRSTTIATDIAAQTRKPSAHRAADGAVTSRNPGRIGRTGIRAAACSDCHEPHRIRRSEASAPEISGLLAGAAGVDRNGLEIRAARFEYEVCFRCHADDTPTPEFVPRVVGSTNLRRELDPANASYHPVVGMGRVAGVPSIPSRFEPSLTASSMIYCTDCHSDDEGKSRGPHGSDWAPILRLRYETSDGTVESPEAYALCYRCHERYSILADASFRRSTVRRSASGGGHSGHLAAGAPCSACHDPHGIPGSGAGLSAGTGSHSHLVNFDVRIVQPLPGARFPIYTDAGSFSGSCDLVCHGVTHQHASYP